MHDFCNNLYTDLFNREFDTRHSDFVDRNHREPAESTLANMESDAQKYAIRMTTIQAMREFDNVEPADIWNSIHQIHVHRKSGLDIPPEVIESVISGEQSWKSSSGHAFEEIVAESGTAALHPSGIDIILQRDLTELIQQNDLHNEQPDIEWLRKQIAADIFDAFAITKKDGETVCFGCIQCKTSLRDRVTRDREPSINAMKKFFWSALVVLNGETLNHDEQKYAYMVNGGSTEFPTNGWHGMYVFSNALTSGRIYPTNLDMKNFKEHAIQAAERWCKQRQWLNADWNPREK